MSRWEPSPHGAHPQLCSANSLQCKGMRASAISGEPNNNGCDPFTVQTDSASSSGHWRSEPCLHKFQKEEPSVSYLWLIHSLQMGYTFCQTGQLSLFPPKEHKMVLQNLILLLLSTPGFSRNVWASSTMWQRKQESTEGIRDIYLVVEVDKAGLAVNKEQDKEGHHL